MKTNYPWQIDSIIHKTKASTKTFGMDALLFTPKEEDDFRTPAAPLEMHEGYSVFKGTLIEKKDSGTDFLKFNIPAKAVPFIHKKTCIAIEQAAAKKAAPVQSQNTEAGSGTSSAYTVTIKTGKLAGKTPAQALLEGKDEFLKNQKLFLEKNLDKYPANKEQIDAINDAFQLRDSGKLSADTTAAAGTGAAACAVTVIYECAPKNVKPLDEEGRYTIYQVTVTHNPAMNLPFTVSVMNCFAPVDKSKGNEIVLSKAVNKKTLEIKLSEEEWFTMIDKMKATKIMFENHNYPEQLKLARKISKENYEASFNK